MSGAPEVIRSRANQHLKRVTAVRAGRERDFIVLEGERLIGDALAAGLALELLLVAEDRAADEAFASARIERRLVVDTELLGRTSGLEHSPGLLALARRPEARAIDALELDEDALVLVVAGVSDPGNLGALARSAEAAGVRAMVVLAGGARPWSDKALRGSMGSLLRLPIALAESADAAADALAARGLRQVVAATRGGSDFRRFDWSGAVAIWVTPETGEAPAVCEHFEAVTIPMAGGVESLNVSVAASLLLFAAADGRGSANDEGASAR